MNGVDYFLEKMIFENPLAARPHLNKKGGDTFFPLFSLCSLTRQNCQKMGSEFVGKQQISHNQVE